MKDKGMRETTIEFKHDDMYCIFSVMSDTPILYSNFTLLMSLRDLTVAWGYNPFYEMLISQSLSTDLQSFFINHYNTNRELFDRSAGYWPPDMLNMQNRILLGREDAFHLFILWFLIRIQSKSVSYWPDHTKVVYSIVI